MRIKERILEKLDDADTKELWKEIYDAFEQGGEEKVKEILVEKAKKIKYEFDSIKNNIEKQIGG